MRNLGFVLIFVSWIVSANETRLVEGNYLRYEGTDYESAFFPCQNAQVWTIAGGKAFAALVDYYRYSRTSMRDEIKVSLELIVSPIDRNELPNSHYDAIAEVLAVISISENENEISSCRENPL